MPSTSRPRSHPEHPAVGTGEFLNRRPGRLSRRGLARLLWCAFACWACGILWLSSLAPDELPDAAFLFWDKANHFGAFLVGGWLAATALRVSRPGWEVARALTLSIVLVAAFGALDELVQTLTPGRVGGDVVDWTADALGAIAGALVSRATHNRVRRLHHQTATLPQCTHLCD